MQYPMRVTRFELASTSGGQGRHSGGAGVIRELEMLSDVTGTILSDRRRLRPWGLAGGSPGLAGRNTMIHKNGKETPLNGKARFEASIGDRVRIVTPAGGGWGSV